MAKNLNNVKNETPTLVYLEYGKKTEKMWIIRHTHCMTVNMGRNTEKREK
jgi:hypothetical protein